MKKALCALMCSLPVLGSAQSVWITPSGQTPDDALDISNGANWSPTGKPVAGSQVVIGVSSALAFDVDLSVSSLTISENVSTLFVPYGSESLTIGNGGLNLGSGASATLDVIVLSSANSTWNIGGASATFNGLLYLSTGTVSLNISNGGSLTLANPNNPIWTGALAIVGTGTYSISATSFRPENLDKVKINGNTVEIKGDKLVPVSNIPESSSAGALASCAALLGTLLRRRRQA